MGRGWRQVRRFGVFELLTDMLMCIQVENKRGQGTLAGDEMFLFRNANVSLDFL